MVMEDANKKRMCTIYLVRHGETEWNVAGRLQGHGDSSLTEKGRSQARFLGKKLAKIQFDAVYSSDLGRARETAELIILSKKLAVQTTLALRERSFGDHEGMTVDHHRELIRELLEKFETLTDEEKYRFKYNNYQESDQELAGRLATYLREISVTNSGKTVLMVSHGGIIRAFLIVLGFGAYSELDYGAVKNSSFIKLECDGTDFFIRQVDGVEKR